MLCLFLQLYCRCHRVIGYGWLMLQATISTTRKWEPNQSKHSFHFMSDWIQLKSVPNSGQIAPLHFCSVVMACVWFVVCLCKLLLLVFVFCYLVQTQFVGESLRYTYKLCDMLQLLPTATWQEGAAALTFTRVPICHQRESKEAGAASLACPHCTLLIAGAIFCRRQMNTCNLSTIVGFCTALPLGHSLILTNSLFLLLVLLLCWIHSPVVSCWGSMWTPPSYAYTDLHSLRKEPLMSHHT